ncbi:Lactose-binding lectin l-2 [Nibea albiflora]|uniref:Lactose-binding lectin l-2 n=1 Tax=Nibea albiflora TaxID=240163 RepID=A0ACB7ESH1_NIBAL|nr:Lactose-binding lectin l-2 [Nibea albiflora]
MLLFLSLFGLALGAVSPSDEMKLQRGSCPMFWYSFNGRCYKYVATHLTWADAELHCVSQKANLVSIHSEEEYNFIKDLTENFDHTQGPTWIGLSDTQKEGGWMWSDGSAVDFVSWNRNEPNGQEFENCVHMNSGTERRWNDMSCSKYFPSVCESHISCP